MPKLSEAIYNFLQARKTTNADLVDRWSIEMETQINVAADNGEPVDGKRGTYTDGEYTWFNVRIPKNAAGDPEFRDYELRWPLDLHVEGIGMTGWKWAYTPIMLGGFRCRQPGVPCQGDRHQR